MSGVLNVSNLIPSRDNQPKELSLRQNEYYLKQFNFVRLSSSPPSQPANYLLSSLARPYSTRRDRGSYASRVLSWSACSNSTSRSYRQKKDNHNIWFDLGDWINSPMCICGTSLIFGHINNIIYSYFRTVVCS